MAEYAGYSFHDVPRKPERPLHGRLIELMSLLWLAGVAMRMTILAMPPVIPLVHSELRMSETQVGLLIGLPLALFAVAAVPGRCSSRGSARVPPLCWA